MPYGAYERRLGMRSVKLSQAQRDEIKALAGDKCDVELDTKLGALFGVSRFTVICIRRGWWRRGYPVGGKKVVDLESKIYGAGERVGCRDDHDGAACLEEVQSTAADQLGEVAAEPWADEGC